MGRHPRNRPRAGRQLKTTHAMKYNTATIDATFNDQTITFDLDGVGGEDDMMSQLFEQFTEGEEPNDEEREDFPQNVTFSNPQGFAVHLFDSGKLHLDGNRQPVDNFDEILEKWNDETDEDRREAMGEYLEDMGADDLSDFDEAYQGQWDSGAAFAEQLADDLGAVDENNARWICIDWDRTWECNLRHDYHITSGGHVFRNL